MNKALITEKQQQRDELYARIAARYKELMSIPGSQITAVVAAICKEMNVGQDTVYRARRQHRLHKRRIDRCDVANYHDRLLASGKKSSEAKRETAERFGITQNYVYQIVRLAAI